MSDTLETITHWQLQPGDKITATRTSEDGTVFTVTGIANRCGGWDVGGWHLLDSDKIERHTPEWHDARVVRSKYGEVFAKNGKDAEHPWVFVTGGPNPFDHAYVAGHGPITVVIDKEGTVVCP